MSRTIVSHDGNSHIPPRQTDYSLTAEWFYRGYSTYLRKYATKMTNSKKNNPLPVHAQPSVHLQYNMQDNDRTVYTQASCECLVSTTGFVEEYVTNWVNHSKQNMSSQPRLCLCELDSAQQCHMRVHVGILAARYNGCVMNYTLTSREHLKQAQFLCLTAATQCVQFSTTSTEAIDANSCLYNYKHRQHLLRYVSGCDKDGWLAHKHAFINNEIACGRLLVLPHEHALIATVYSIMNQLRLDCRNRDTRAGFCMHIEQLSGPALVQTVASPDSS